MDLIEKIKYLVIFREKPFKLIEIYQLSIRYALIHNGFPLIIILGLLYRIVMMNIHHIMAQPIEHADVRIIICVYLLRKVWNSILKEI